MRRSTRFAPFAFALALALALAAGALLAAPAAADFRLEKNLPLAPGGELVVETAGGSVTVTGGASTGARIVVTSERDRAAVEERYTFEFSSEGGQARVINKRRSSGWFGGWFDWGRGLGLHFEIQVPRQTRVDLHSSGGGIRVSSLQGAARLRSSGGAVRAFDIGGDVEARSSGGGVEVRRVHGDLRLGSSGGRVTAEQITGDVTAESSGGGVDVSEVSGDVDASSSGGGVHVDGIGGRVTADSSGGPVTAVLAASNTAGASLSSSGGGVRVAVDAGARLSIDASSSGGSVVCDLPVTVQGKQSR
ncbi:MAG TPA: hypothetical protein VN811_13350, partial [Thermoanaerobaculia bacterium]|nr:hypothetical protein [Thermoanaerobaculia bacterium]